MCALSSQVVLIAEDNPLIACDMAELVIEAGADVVCAQQVDEALVALRRSDISAALLDVQLGAEGIEPVCRRLDGSAIPFLFVTGGDTAVAPRWQKTPVVRKPFRADELIQALIRVLVDGGVAPHELPPSLLHALRLICKAEERIERQRRLVKMIAQSGGDAQAARRLLGDMCRMLALMREHARVLADTQRG